MPKKYFFLLLLLLPGLGFAQPPLEHIRLPEGFSISVFADKVRNARVMVLGDKGTLFVSTRQAGNVYALRDDNNDGYAEKVFTVARGLNMPNGIALRDGALFVAAVDRILRYDDIEARLANPPKPVVITDRLPKDRAHGWRYIAFGPDDKLYVPIGAPCNVCDEPGYAELRRMNPDGSQMEVFARGIRNTVGFTWHPETRELWITENGRDWLGDDLPPDELLHAPRPGLHFGFPYCHGDAIPDPEFGKGHDCADYTAPALLLGPHVAALGIAFYTGQQFPERYRGQIFIAEHGSWNRSRKIGYRVSMVTLKNGQPTSYEPFAEWLDSNDNEKVWGRPAYVLVTPDGSLLVSDDQEGIIYRISYRATR